MDIIYYAPDSGLGDTPTDECAAFRRWAMLELVKEYPKHSVSVSPDESLSTIFTNDVNNEEQIRDFCSRLWDAYDGE